MTYYIIEEATKGDDAVGMRSVLYEYRWQQIRVGCLRKYNFKGGWTTKEGVVANLLTLDQYLTKGEKQGTQEESVRIFRVVNLLNATRMGYNGQRTGLSGDAKDLIDILDEEVIEFRDAIQDGWEYDKQAVVKVGFDWDWSKVEDGVRDGLLTNPGWFDAIHEDLLRRNTSAGIASNRSELNRFLSIMDKVKHGR